MKIKKLRIENYKSISKIEIPFISYGSHSSKSSTAIFVGINESGKSNILEALNLIRTGFDGLVFDQICNKSHQEEAKYVDLWVELEIENHSFYRKKLIDKMPSLKEIIEGLKLEFVEKNIYLDEKNEAHESYELKLSNIKDLYKYVVTETKKTVDNQPITSREISLLSIKNKIEEKITASNAKEYLKENQKLLTQDHFESECLEIIETNLNASIPKTVYWQARENYLINNAIDLSKFKEDTSISIPLKNIFRIYGKKNDEEIKNTIEKALKTPAKNAELVDSLSESLTKHVNRIWKEHKINLKVHLNGNMCSVHVEDKSKKHEYYTMKERSDGFRQFVSLILSLSAETESDALKNKLVLLDEPEVHLHPSGIRFMRDELLKIGKKNNVFISTHSHYMIDTKTSERHWIVLKNKDTQISQLTETDNIKDEEVLAKAFGLDLMKELLPGNILLVEGLGDKKVINHLIQITDGNYNYSIKSAGGGPKVYSIASMMAEEDIKALVVVDDDTEGRRTKSEILGKLKDTFDNDSVYTLRDVLGSLPNHSTIEDILPIDLVKSIFKKSFEKDLVITSGKPIISLITTQEDSLRGKENKEKLEKFKIEMCEEFVEQYSDIKRLEKVDSLSIAFINELLKKLE